MDRKNDKYLENKLMNGYKWGIYNAEKKTEREKIFHHKYWTNDCTKHYCLISTNSTILTSLDNILMFIS